MSELDKTQEGLNKSEVHKKQELNETVGSNTFNYTFDESSHFEESSFFHIPNRILLNIMQILQHQ